MLKVCGAASLLSALDMSPTQPPALADAYRADGACLVYNESNARLRLAKTSAGTGQVHMEQAASPAPPYVRPDEVSLSLFSW